MLKLCCATSAIIATRISGSCSQSNHKLLQHPHSFPFSMPPQYTTGTHSASWDSSGLPKSLREYLAVGAEVGNRDNALFKAACQARDAGLSQNEAKTLLVGRAIADGLSEKVAKSKIRSAYNRAARPAAGNSGTAPSSPASSVFSSASCSRAGRARGRPESKPSAGK